MTTNDNIAPISSAGELLAHAYQMELDAQERYDFLADQMETHNNTGLARLFRELSRIEGLHANDIAEQMKGMDIPEIRPMDFKFPDEESPETLDMGEMHYLMTPRQALQLALRAEQNAFAFFNHILKVTTDEEVKGFAAEFAEEEEEHVELVLRELSKYPESEERQREDPDQPVSPE